MPTMRAIIDATILGWNARNTYGAEYDPDTEIFHVGGEQMDAETFWARAGAGEFGGNALREFLLRDRAKRGES